MKITDKERSRLLKSYLKRLSDGEDLEAVRADFKANFKDVDASEIMKAEQDLMAEGTPLSDVQKLCDLHSALFHGATRLEKIMNAERAVNESLAHESEDADDSSGKNAKAAGLENIPGHPLYTFSRENRALKQLLSQAENAERKELADLLPKIREVSIHYAKKGDLLYPVLKVNYDITGPSEVMWTVDDEIRNELSDLEKQIDEKGADSLDEEWENRVRAVVTRADEMIYKEENILFPICAVNFKDSEWKEIYKDSKDYDKCLNIENENWESAADPAPSLGLDLSKAEIRMSGGHMTLEQLTAVLNTIPMEISFVDENDINCFFNEGPKVFKRPQMAIGRKVFSCHPPKIEPMVRSIISDFREGKKDEVPVWMEKNGRTMLVRYMAVRDKGSRYLGTMEVVQDMEFAKKHFEK